MHHRDATSLTPQWKKGLFNCHQEKNEISLHFLEIVSRFLFVSLPIFLYQVRKYINQVPLVGSVKVPWVDAFLQGNCQGYALHSAAVRGSTSLVGTSHSPSPQRSSLWMSLIYFFEFNILFSGNWESGKTRERTHPPAHECLYDLQQTSPSPCPSETPPPRQQNSEQDTW